MFVFIRYWKPACIAAWLIFITYEGFIGYDYYYSTQPLCPHSDNTDQWYLSTCAGVATGFLLTLLIVCMKIIKIKDDDIEKIPYLVMLNIVLINSIGTFLSIFFNWGGICIDSLG
jgi:hypothetical protein